MDCPRSTPANCRPAYANCCQDAPCRHAPAGQHGSLAGRCKLPVARPQSAARPGCANPGCETVADPPSAGCRALCTRRPTGGDGQFGSNARERVWARQVSTFAVSSHYGRRRDAAQGRQQSAVVRPDHCAGPDWLVGSVGFACPPRGPASISGCRRLLRMLCFVVY